MKPITVVVASAPGASAGPALERVAASGLVESCLELRAPAIDPPDRSQGPAGAAPLSSSPCPGAPRLAGVPCECLQTAWPGGSEALAWIASRARTPFLLHVHPGAGLDPAPHALDRLVAAATGSGAFCVYGDYAESTPAGTRPHPLPDHQEGSIRETFDFGPLVLWAVKPLQQALAEPGASSAALRFHAFHDARLRAGLLAPIVHLPEVLALQHRRDDRPSGAAVFDYLTAGHEPRIEAERVATAHLERLGARLRGPFRTFEPSGTYPVEASVVIPVRNRAGTIADAVTSALDQKVDFPFNVIVVDNHSTDGTTRILEEMAGRDRRVVHVRPTALILGIGGCWNEAVFHPSCGRYAVQLDSDDLYADASALAAMVRALRDAKCAMAIGSYTTVDRSLQPIPPGLIDHREWTDENGANNALRIEGLGAPRAFAVDVVRRCPFPNVSYGEDYAMALRICREYRISRVYESIYLCRRWEDNTDAALSPELLARHQHYKDRLRSIEIEARRRLNGNVKHVDGFETLARTPV